MTDLFDVNWYLAGPMRGYPEHNFPNFIIAATRLRGFGFKITSPVEINPEAAKEAAENPDYGYGFLQKDIVILSTQCNGIILLPGWSKSYGAKLELQVALGFEYVVAHWNGCRLTEIS